MVLSNRGGSSFVVRASFRWSGAPENGACSFCTCLEFKASLSVVDCLHTSGPKNIKPSSRAWLHCLARLINHLLVCFRYAQPMRSDSSVAGCPRARWTKNSERSPRGHRDPKGQVMVIQKRHIARATSYRLMILWLDEVPS